MNEINLENICRNVDIYSKDSFVGIKCKEDNIEVIFPMGYRIGKNTDDIRRNILSLIKILSEFTKRTDSEWKRECKEDITKFPIYSYLYVIRDYLTNGYYAEKEIKYNVAKKGKINWNRTIKTQKLYPTENGFIYLDFVVKDNSINQNELITLVHEACVYRCFKKLGWLYTSFLPTRSRLGFDKKLFENVVIQSMAKTFNDKKRELFGHLLNVIKEFFNSHIHLNLGKMHLLHIFCQSL